MKTIAVAGASGDQGQRVIRELCRLGVKVRALIRQPLSVDLEQQFKKLNVAIVEVDYQNNSSLKKACLAVDCMISALSGNREVIMQSQVELLKACTEAKVKRFIPSAYSIDFKAVPIEKNRNLAVLREFDEVLATAEIRPTTILNGAFADMLTGQAPFILYAIKRVIYFSSADQKMDFTTRDNVATYTAHAALDETAPRFLRIAGDEVSARDLASMMTRIENKNYNLLKLGSTSGLSLVIKFIKNLMGSRGGKYPIWQGLQYMHNMFSGLGKFAKVDNQRYDGIQWTSIESVLRAHFDKQSN